MLGGVAVAGLVGLLVLLRRRRSGEESGPLAEGGASAARAVPLKEAAPSIATQLAEVDELLAAGELAGAGIVARNLLDSNPTQPQVVMKLFEIYRASGDAKAFSSLAKKLAATGFAADNADDWTRVEEMGRELLPGDRLFAPEAPAAEVMEQVVEAEPERDLGDMLETLETRLGEGDEGLREEAAEALVEAAAHLDTGSEPATLPAAGAPEVTGALRPPDAGPDREESLKFEPLAPSEEEAVDAQGPAQEEEDTIEFDLDSLERPSSMAADAAEPADEAVSGDVGDTVDALEFTPLTTDEETADDRAAGEVEGALDAPAPLASTVVGGEAEVPGEEGPGDLDNIVSLRPEEPPTSEAVVETDEDEVQTKLDLARAFLDLGDAEGARGILEEVVAEGNERQREEAESLLSNTG